MHPPQEAYVRDWQIAKGGSRHFLGGIQPPICRLSPLKL